MLKVRIIPILTFNGFALVKTKQFANPRMVGNAVQAARVYNSRAVDELAFIDIFATQQNRKINLKETDIITLTGISSGISFGIDDSKGLLIFDPGSPISDSSSITASVVKNVASICNNF